jgi:hypothetical protein
MRRLIRLAAALITMAMAFTACLTQPGDTSHISLVSTSTVNGWKYDFYQNSAYPCSISGFQTFMVGTKVGTSATASAPLWVWMHGGGVGYFSPSGTPLPDSTQMTQNTPNDLRSGLTNPGLLTNVRADPAGFRLLAVSYCNRDLYGGTGQTDPNNPNKNADGSARTTNGLLATKAAIQFTESTYPTSKYFLHGASAGSAGAYYAAWALQQSGIPPAGVVGDASLVNIEAQAAAFQQGACTKGDYNPVAQPVIEQRLDPQIADINNEVDKLVSTGQLTVPLLHIWNHADVSSCGATPVQCPLRIGSVVTMGTTDCDHAPLAAAIAAEGPNAKSENLPLCVQLPGTPACSLHQVTLQAGLVNTDPASPSDYLGAIMTWVDQRLHDAQSSS